MPIEQETFSEKMIREISRSNPTRSVISTLDKSVQISNERASGNTIRQVDFAIQKLFEGYLVICLDHNRNGESRDSNNYLQRAILKRIESEHRNLPIYIRSLTLSI